MEIVGRKEEIQIMQSYLNDKKAHLLAMIGRRRVGKTFLIRQVYKKNKAFEMTGLKDADLDGQLLNFTLQMNEYFPKRTVKEKPESWLLAFNQLTQCLLKAKTLKPVVFFDELPWIASKRSGFMEALAHWWNNWASQQNMVVVVCGSAASWMLDHVVNAKGGLHNRITRLITLNPFTLAETQQFFVHKKITLSPYQIVQLYLSLGGIPHYLEHVQKGLSAAQNIQHLCFEKNGILKNEFDNLYPALFDNVSKHIKVIKALASKSMGLDRQNILATTNISDGGWFSKLLAELETSGFIATYEPLEKKKKDTLYRLTDEFSLFYIKFMASKTHTDWMTASQGQKYKIWCGYAFENLCIKHVSCIKKALGISGVQSHVNSFLHRKNETYGKGFQIDMLIDRKDDVLNICEMKFYADEFTINEEYAKKIRTKKQGLIAVTGSKKTVHTAFITSYGVMENQYKMDLVDHDLTIDIFFED